MNFPELFVAHQSASFVGTFLTIHHVRTGNIQVLKSCPHLASVNFDRCKMIEGEHT